VLVEYDLHDDSFVAVRHLDGRFICEARLDVKKPWLSESRIVDAEQRAMQHATERLERKIEEVQQRARFITDEQLAAFALLRDEQPERLGAGVDAPAPEWPSSEETLDIYSTDY
jgi:putative transposase